MLPCLSGFAAGKNATERPVELIAPKPKFQCALFLQVVRGQDRRVRRAERQRPRRPAQQQRAALRAVRARALLLRRHRARAGKEEQSSGIKFLFVFLAASFQSLF